MRILLSSLAVLALCSCAGSYRDGSLENSRHFGRANAANIAAQAEAARSDQSTTDGNRMATAVARYKDGDPAPANAPAAPAASDIGGHN